MRSLLLPFLLAQACSLPTNPPVTREIRWADAETAALARRACYDCHSNETDWKVMHTLPGIERWVTQHVTDGRCALNFSEWDTAQPMASLAASDVLSGRMPLASYAQHRPKGRLTPSEQQTLAQGITATLAADPPSTSGATSCSAGSDTGSSGGVADVGSPQGGSDPF